MKILQVADRPGWAIDRLSKPLSQLYPNVDMSYFSTSAERYLDSGYSEWKTSVHFTQELGELYDVIHFHRVEAAERFNMGKFKKKIITVHTERPEDWNDPRLLDFDTVIAPTKYAKEMYEKNFELMKNCVHIPHGIDLDKYFPVEGIKRDGVGFVGRIVPWKRWGHLQKACRANGIKVIGCGYIEKGSLYNEHGLREGEEFEYQIFVPEKIMNSFFNKMRMFACLSKPYIEAGPLPLMEAMAAGVPVFSTKVGWAADYAEHEKNIYFINEQDVENPGKLMEIIKTVYKNDSLLNQIRKGGLELIKNFGIKQYAEKLMEIYEK